MVFISQRTNGGTGYGGGIRHSEIALGRLREHGAIIAVWAVSKAILDEFEQGEKLWSEVKMSAVPFFSSIGVKEDWHLIQDRMRELLSKD